MQPLNTCPISVSSFLQFNQLFSSLQLCAGHYAWHSGGKKVKKTFVQRETDTINSRRGGFERTQKLLVGVI